MYNAIYVAPIFLLNSYHTIDGIITRDDILALVAVFSFQGMDLGRQYDISLMKSLKIDKRGFQKG